MSAAWKEVPFAPASGTKICASAEMTGAIKSFDLNGFPLLLVRSAEGLRGYVNACTHQFLPLDWRSDKVLSGDGSTIRCSNHDAGFDACTGQGKDGLGQGCALNPVPVVESGRTIRIL